MWLSAANVTAAKRWVTTILTTLVILEYRQTILGMLSLGAMHTDTVRAEIWNVQALCLDGSGLLGPPEDLQVSCWLRCEALQTLVIELLHLHRVSGRQIPSAQPGIPQVKVG